MRKKLLIIDDFSNHILIIERQLCSEGYDVSFVNSVAEINSYLRINLPDIVLIDVQMGNNEGFEILKDLKREYKIKCPLIVFSRAKDDDLISKAFNYGAYDYLIKPLNLRDLKNKIVYALG